MSFVVDSSIALSWCFSDEHSDATNRLLHEVARRGAVVPAHWQLEVLNGLAMGQQRGLLDATRRKTITGFLRDLPIRVDDATTEQAWVATATLAARHRLTVYDAAYLELAHRLALPLATLDQELRTAAGWLRVALLGASTDPVDF